MGRDLTPLEPPDGFHVQAAQGWLELGNAAEAAAELERIAPEHWKHPDVLKVRWEVQAAGRNWDAALEVAKILIELDPQDPGNWVHQSYCLHELKRTAEALEHLLRVVDNFPLSATMRYNLACYECQLGRLTEAKDWLKRAFALGDAASMKQAALEDPDLEPLRSEIGKI